MQISKQKVDKQTQNQIQKMLAQVIADIKDQDKAMVFLHDFLTETELVALSKRLTIAFYLDKGMSYEQIKKELKVSSATVATVAEEMKKNHDGYQLALSYIKAEEFANKWTEKITGIFGKK